MNPGAWLQSRIDAWRAWQRRRAFTRIRAAYAILGTDVARLSDDELRLIAFDALAEPPKKPTDHRYTFRVRFDDGCLQLDVFEIEPSGRRQFAFGPIPLDRRGAIVLGKVLLDNASRVVSIHEARPH